MAMAEQWQVMAEQWQYGVVLVTASSRTAAEAIAQTVLTTQLAACVNLFPVHSLYIWQGNLETTEEWQLLIKTTWEKCPELAAQIRAIHSYEVPEIIVLPILAGSRDYLTWIKTQVNPAPGA
jgi:periplasmic divalent cation tolerance protein